MAVEFPERIIDIGDKLRAGMYRDFETEVGSRIGQLVEGDGLPSKFRLVRRSVGNSEGPWEDVNIEDAVIVFGVGEGGKGPTSGTWSLSYDGSTTGLTGLAYNISATALQTALNANTTLSAGGASVTVTKFNSTYQIAWNVNGVRSLLVATVTALSPEISTDVVTRVATGDSTHPELQILELLAKPYASSSVWTPYVDEGVTVTEKQVGTGSKKAVRLLTFASQPYAGNVIVNFPKPEKVKITARANAAAAEVFTLTVLTSLTTSALAGKFLLCYDDAGPVYVWFEVSAVGTAPAAPLGGRNIKITLLNADTAFGVATKIATAMDADAKFIATQGSNVVTVTASASGTRTAPSDVNAAANGVTVAETVAGSAGSLAGLYFVLQEAAGSLAVWFSVGGSAVPAGALAFNRQLSVTLTAGDSANTVATAIATAITTDASYTAAAVANVVTATDSVGGDRDDASAGTSGFTIKISQVGKAITATIAYNATAADLQAALENYWLVYKRGFNFVLQCSETAVQPAFAIDSDGLIYPNGIEGSINLNTLGMFRAFGSTDADFLTLVFSGKIRFSGQLPYTFYRETILIYRDALNYDAIAPVETLSVTEAEGVADLVATEESHSILFLTTLPANPTKFELTLLIPSGGVIFGMAVDRGTVDTFGFTIVLGVAVPASGYKVAWRAKV